MKALAGAVVHTGHEASPTLRLTFRNEGLLMAHYGELCIAIWSQKPTRATFEVQQAELKAAVGRSPGRAHFMCVVGVGSDPPDPEIRSASSQMINAQGARLASCACVIEGSGFRAALARTALSGIALLVRSPTPLKFFEGISSAALWQQERGARGSMAQLISGLRTLRDAERR